MSSFYGNGGYSSGGGGGSGEVISVNGKKGQVTLTAADVHALPEDTLIPSLDGFATEEWVNNQDFLTSGDISSKADISTTLSGYGITDAYTKTEINEMIPENNLTNIVDGSASGSVRGINTKLEDSSYKMGSNAWAEGLNTMASGEGSHAEGTGAIASGDFSHAEGREETLELTLSGDANSLTYTFDYVDEDDADYIDSFIFSGVVKLVSNDSSDSTTVTNIDIENKTLAVDTTLSTEAINNVEYTLTIYPTASGAVSHVEGTSVASGKYTHAEGYLATASGTASHAQGMGTIASKNAQFALGTYNIEDDSTAAVHPGGFVKAGQYAVIVGNGYEDTTNKQVIRSNAHTLDWQGNGWYAGKLTVGSAPTENLDVATKQYVDNAMSDYALKSEIPTITNDFTNDYKNKVDSLWEDYQDAITALG